MADKVRTHSHTLLFYRHVLAGQPGVARAFALRADVCRFAPLALLSVSLPDHSTLGDGHKPLWENFFCSSLNPTCIIALRLSHDFLHRILIVKTMIYKRRYEWHKDVFILFKRFDDQREIVFYRIWKEYVWKDHKKHLCVTHSVVCKSLLHNRSFEFWKKKWLGLNIIVFSTYTDKRKRARKKRANVKAQHHEHCRFAPSLAQPNVITSR